MAQHNRMCALRNAAAVLFASCLCACASESMRGSNTPQPFSQTIRIGIVPFDRVLSARERPEVTERPSTLETLFQSSQCQPFEDDEPPASLKPPGVVCFIPGESDETILVTSEYGKGRRPRKTVGNVSSGQRRILRRRDGWEAASLLPLIAEAISAVPRKNSILFAAFEDAPDGLRTADGINRTLTLFPPNAAPKIKAWISLTAVGVSTRGAWREGSSEELLADFLAVSRHAGIPARVTKRAKRGSRGRPEESDTPMLAVILGHDYDDDYLASYRFLAAFVAFADVSIDARRDPATAEPEDPLEMTPL